MILGVGATEQIGRELINCRASTRACTGARVEALELQQKGIDVVIGDLAQPETLDVALRGVEKAFLVSSHSPQQVALQGNFVQAAEWVHLGYLVKLSVPGAALVRSMPLPVGIGKPINRSNALAYPSRWCNLYSSYRICCCSAPRSAPRGRCINLAPEQPEST